MCKYEKKYTACHELKFKDRPKRWRHSKRILEGYDCLPFKIDKVCIKR